SRWRWQRLPRVHESTYRSNRGWNLRFRDRLTHARPTRTRQHESSANFRGSTGRLADVDLVRRALYRHVPVSRDLARCAREIIDEGRNLWLEFGNADESRAARTPNSRSSSQSSAPRRWHLKCLGHIARYVRRWLSVSDDFRDNRFVVEEVFVLFTVMISNRYYIA